MAPADQGLFCCDAMIVGAVMSSALSMRVLTPGWPPLISCRNHVGALDGADKATGFEINVLSSHHLMVSSCAAFGR
jgi:hypothetical protein